MTTISFFNSIQVFTSKSTHSLVDNGLCHMQSGAPDSTSLMPEKDVVHAGQTDCVWA